MKTAKWTAAGAAGTAGVPRAGRLLAVVVACLLCAPSWAAQSPADATFQNLYQQEWSWRTGQSGVSTSGESQPNSGRLDDVGAASQQQRLVYWKQILKQLDAIDATQLSEGNKVNAAIYREQIGNFVADQHFNNWQMPFNSDSAFWSDVGYELGGGSLHTVDDYHRYLDKLDQIPAYFDQQIANMKLGLKRGFSVPRAVLNGRDVSIASVAELKDPTESTFYKPFKQLPASISADDAQALQGEAMQRIRDHVIPAYTTLLTFFRSEYMPRARSTLAAEAMPNGKAYYRQQIHEYTTLDLSPDAIHQIGLEHLKLTHRHRVITATYALGIPVYLLLWAASILFLVANTMLVQQIVASVKPAHSFLHFATT
ncbi:MAG: hypothetical protein WDW36_006987 [Sanguina aurantia]